MLGECPVWCERTRRLYWAYIEGSEPLASEEGSEIVMRWSLPERLGTFVLAENEDVLLMGLASNLMTQQKLDHPVQCHIELS